ncbi:MAG: ABC transporter permease [Peptostreptococcaceae bacterium]
MFVKLSLNNIKHSMKDYLIYFTTLTICVSLFFGFVSISSPNNTAILNQKYDFELLMNVIKYATYFISSMLTILILYVNNYMIRRKKREFATYIILGIDQRRVSFMFFIETFCIGIASILCGLIVGALLSQVLLSIILLSVNQNFNFSFIIYSDTIVKTVVFFICMFGLIGIINMRHLSKIKLIDMFNGDKKTEIDFGSKKFKYIICFIISILGYIYFVIGINNLLNIYTSSTATIPQLLNTGLQAIVSLIVATYSLFYSLSYLLVIFKKKNTNLKYTNTNLFLIGSLLSKLKTAPTLMASISITLVFAIICIVLGPVLSEIKKGEAQYKAPYDIKIETSDFTDVTSPDNLINDVDYSDILDYMNKENITLKDSIVVRKYFLKESDLLNRDNNTLPSLAISLSDYNKMRSMLGYSTVSLDNKNYLLQFDKSLSQEDINKFIEENKNLSVENNILSFSGNYYTDTLGNQYNHYAPSLIVLPDNICTNLLVAGTDFYATTTNELEHNQAKKLENSIKEWFKIEYKDIYTQYENIGNPSSFTEKRIEVRSKILVEGDSLSSILVFRMLSMYFGIILFMISLVILAIQQLSESIDGKNRYIILYKIGVDKNDIYKLIFRQIAIYFTLPMILALIGSVGFFSVYGIEAKNYIQAYISSNGFIMSVSTSLSIIVFIYGSYFIATYYTFKRNIQ